MKPLLLIILFTEIFANGSSVLAQEINKDIRIGDPEASYASVEFTKDGKYMVWYEGEKGNIRGSMWHCAIDQATGTPNPPDCRGFKAFPSTAFGRANVGYDSKGPFYVGANTQGEVIMVRPTGATTGTVTKLDAPADPRRKGYYPTQDANDNRAYVVWGTREKTVSSLQYIDIANPSNVYNIETQTKKSGARMTAMDVGFFRIVNGAPLVTFGSVDNNSKIQIKMKDMSKPDQPARFITNDAHNHIDPYGFIDPKGDFYVVSGIDTKALMYVYKYNPETGYLEKQSEITPPSATMLKNPSMATSFEPIFWVGHTYGAYQVNDGGNGQRGYMNVAFQQPGEIWLTDITDPSKPQIKLSGDSQLIRSEPEPLMINNKIWMYYSAAAPGERVMSAKWQLRRSEVPLY